jgi:UDPglucose 6-dehydrogenase
MQGFKVVVDKSTVPVGTADKVSMVIAAELAARAKLRVAHGDALQSEVEHHFSVVSNPEFLKEGAAVEDFMRPDRIVIGNHHDADGVRAHAVMKRLYAPFNRNHERTHWMDVRSAEFTKYAANAMLATRISFMNELANLADKVGVDIEAVRNGIGSDPRIGHSFLYAGCGYGGSCFPKDVQALERTAREYDQELLILRAVEAVNENQKQVLGRKVLERFGTDLHGLHFAVWGLAFKPNTDDMRAASSRVLLRELLSRGASVSVHDPVAMEEAARVLALDFADVPEQFARIRFVKLPMDATAKADALIIVTEWKTYRSPDFDQLKLMVVICLILRI